jgi:hypothetical protein
MIRFVHSSFVSAFALTRANLNVVVYQWENMITDCSSSVANLINSTAELNVSQYYHYYCKDNENKMAPVMHC